MTSDDLKEVPLEDLRTEVKRREELAEAARRERMEARQAKQLITLGAQLKTTPELTTVMGVIDSMLPEHDRGSCSDTDPSNGLRYMREGSPPRCRRCCLIEAVNCQIGTFDMDDFVFTIDVVRMP